MFKNRCIGVCQEKKFRAQFLKKYYDIGLVVL